MSAPLLAAVGSAQTTSPEPCLGPSQMVSHRRNRSTGDYEPAEAERGIHLPKNKGPV